SASSFLEPLHEIGSVKLAGFILSVFPYVVQKQNCSANLAAQLLQFSNLLRRIGVFGLHLGKARAQGIDNYQRGPDLLDHRHYVSVFVSMAEGPNKKILFWSFKIEIFGLLLNDPVSIGKAIFIVQYQDPAFLNFAA